MLDEHKKRLNQQLDQTARSILWKIVNEENYHQVNQMYFDAFRNRGEEEISKMKEQCDSKLSQLSGEIANLHLLQQRTGELERKNKNLKSIVNMMSWIFGGVATGLFSIFGYFILKE